MSYKELLRNRLVKRQRPDFDQIAKQISRARKDLKTAEANLSIDTSWAVTIAYHAMLRSGRALMYSQGYLPTAKRSHKTIVQATSKALGKDYSALIARFNRLRRRRHGFIYATRNHISLREARSALSTANKLIDKIASVIRKENPQRELKF